MTDEERRHWERDNPKEVLVDPKKKWRFLQKYWHKGAFFQAGSDNPYAAENRDNIFGRDYSAPTGEDKLDKTVLPKVRVRVHVCVRIYQCGQLHVGVPVSCQVSIAEKL